MDMQHNVIKLFDRQWRLQLSSISKSLITSKVLVVMLTMPVALTLPTVHAVQTPQTEEVPSATTNSPATKTKPAFINREFTSGIQNLGFNKKAGTKDPLDPFESVNRKIFKFNDYFDVNLLKPAAKTYKKHVPVIITSSVTRFYNNLTEPWTAVNQVLQGKFKPALKTSARFLINTSTSLGLADAAATALNLAGSNEDFGQTLGHWGVKPGPYIILPFLGPSTLRDAVALPLDMASNPLSYFLEPIGQYPLTTLRLVDLRANLLAIDGLIDGDQYDILKTIYLQKRQYDIVDGQLPPSSMADSFGDEEIIVANPVGQELEANQPEALLAEVSQSTPTEQSSSTSIVDNKIVDNKTEENTVTSPNQPDTANSTQNLNVANTSSTENVTVTDSTKTNAIPTNTQITDTQATDTQLNDTKVAVSGISDFTTVESKTTHQNEHVSTITSTKMTSNSKVQQHTVAGNSTKNTHRATASIPYKINYMDKVASTSLSAQHKATPQTHSEITQNVALADQHRFSFPTDIPTLKRYMWIAKELAF